MAMWDNGVYKCIWILLCNLRHRMAEVLKHHHGYLKLPFSNPNCSLPVPFPPTCRWRRCGPIWGLRRRTGSCECLGPHSGGVSWCPAWSCPAVRSPPDPSASAASSELWTWTRGTGSRCAAESPSSQTSSGISGGWEHKYTCKLVQGELTAYQKYVLTLVI